MQQLWNDNGVFEGIWQKVGKELGKEFGKEYGKEHGKEIGSKKLEDEKKTKIGLVALIVSWIFIFIFNCFQVIVIVF